MFCEPLEDGDEEDTGRKAALRIANDDDVATAQMLCFALLEHAHAVWASKQEKLLSNAVKVFAFL